jgi:hypothetical protein
MVAAVVLAILSDKALELSRAQLERAPEIVSRHFRLVGST